MTFLCGHNFLKCFFSPVNNGDTLQIKANHVCFASMVTTPNKEAVTGTSSAVGGCYPATEPIASHANDMTRSQSPFNSRTAVQAQPAVVDHETDQLQASAAVADAAPTATDVAQQKVASQVGMHNLFQTSHVVDAQPLHVTVDDA